ncbi:MAG: hypothetical protein J2P49_06830, partial [Methylocapsa sp.]|nr:hypothetical protein [Methylocapsa sp.]
SDPPEIKDAFCINPGFLHESWTTDIKGFLAAELRCKNCPSLQRRQMLLRPNGSSEVPNTNLKLSQPYTSADFRRTGGARETPTFPIPIAPKY